VIASLGVAFPAAFVAIPVYGCSLVYGGQSFFFCFWRLLLGNCSMRWQMDSMDTVAGIASAVIVFCVIIIVYVIAPHIGKCISTILSIVLGWFAPDYT